MIEPNLITNELIVKYLLYTIGAFGGIGVILVGVSAFFGNLLLQKFIYRLQRNNNKELETIKSTLTQNNNKELEALKAIISQNNAFASNLSTNHSATYQKLMTKRLEVVEHYWQCILKAQDTTPNPVNLIYRILTDEETTVKGINSGKSLGTQLASVSMMPSSEALAKISVEIDFQKPFISSKLWLLKYVYFTILGRSTYLLINGYEKNNIILWKRDNMIVQSMQLVLTEAEITHAVGMTIGGMNYVTQLIQNKMIDEIRRFTSNDDFINDSAEQFKKIDAITKGQLSS
jgi:hypothetical protein